MHGRGRPSAKHSPINFLSSAAHQGRRVLYGIDHGLRKYGGVVNAAAEFVAPAVLGASGPIGAGATLLAGRAAKGYADIRNAMEG